MAAVIVRRPQSVAIAQTVVNVVNVVNAVSAVSAVSATTVVSAVTAPNHLCAKSRKRKQVRATGLVRTLDCY